MPFNRDTRYRLLVVLSIASVLILLVSTGPARAQASSEDRVKSYVANVGQELDDAVRMAGSLKSRANWAIAITVLAAFLSLTSGLVPQLKKKWSKPAALVLGFLAGTTTIVNNNVYGVDSALLEANAFDLEKEVADMRTRLDKFSLLNPKGPDYELDLLTWHADIVRDMGKFRDRREELRRPVRRAAAQPSNAGNSGDTSGGLFVTVYAQDKRMQQRALPPSWVQKTPAEDDRFVYFVGQGVDPDSLTDAKDSSVRDAYRQAETYLAGRANTCPIAVLRERAASGSEIAGTYFGSGTVDSSNMRAYTYSTLLRLSKAMADPSLLRTMVARTSGEAIVIPLSRVAAPREFNGNVGVYIGPGTTALRVLVFNSLNVASRWPPARNVRYEELKKSLPPAQILQDVALEKCADTTFRVGDARYVLTMMDIRSAGADQSASVAIAQERMASAKD